MMPVIVVMKRKPDPIKAIQFKDTKESVDLIQNMTKKNIIWHYNHGSLTVPTLEGLRTAFEDDWVVEDLDKNLWVYKTERLLELYEVVGYYDE